MAVLRRFAVHCNLEDILDDMLRDRLRDTRPQETFSRERSHLRKHSICAKRTKPLRATHMCTVVR